MIPWSAITPTIIGARAEPVFRFENPNAAIAAFSMQNTSAIAPANLLSRTNA